MRNTTLVYAGHIDTMSPTQTAHFFRAARKQGDAVKVRKSEINAFAENEAPHKEIETVFSFYHYGVKVATVFAYKVKEAPKAYSFRKTQETNGGRSMVFEGKNAKGQTVTLEIWKCEENPKSKCFKYFLGNLWAKSGYIKAPINSYWCVSECVTESNGDCHSDERYNLTITAHKINREGMKEATPEQLKKILDYATKELNKPFETTDGEGFDDLGSLSDKAYKALEQKAKKCAMKENPFLRWEWGKQACFVSSSNIHGFYFPNLGTSLRCIAFRAGKAVAVYEKAE